MSLGTPLASETVREKWFDFPRTLGLMVLPLGTLFMGAWVWFSLGRSDWKPFAGAVAIYVLAFLGLAYSLFPFVVMDRLTIWDAAAHPSALVFMLVGTAIVLPFIIGYTFYAYRVFRGKVTGRRSVRVSAGSLTLLVPSPRIPARAAARARRDSARRR